MTIYNIYGDKKVNTFSGCFLFADINSFSFEDGKCIGYSFWAEPSSELLETVPESGETSNVLYLAETRLTE